MAFLRGLIVIIIGLFSFSAVYGTEDPHSGETVRVPVIDLAPWFDGSLKQKNQQQEPRRTESTGLDVYGLTEEQRNIVHQIRRACHEVGFFQIVGGLGGRKKRAGDDAMIERTWKASREFFELSVEEKLLHGTTDNTKYPYGYERSETLVKGKSIDGEDEDLPGEKASSSVAAADLKETFAVGPPTGNGSGMPPRQWIDSENISSDFQISLEAYYKRMEELAMVLLRIFAYALGESPDFFEDKMDHHMSALRLVHYYPLEPKAENEDAGKETQEQPIAHRLVRAGAHTDYGALTILAPQDEGLEVLLRDASNAQGTTGEGSSQNKTNKPTARWHPVPLVPGAFVVNLGDLMQRWTNHEWVSTMHRVVMPSTEARERRYSMAYFVNINGDTPIETLRCCRGTAGDEGPVITAGEHLMAKHLASMGITSDKTKFSGSGKNSEL